MRINTPIGLTMALALSVITPIWADSTNPFSFADPTVRIPSGAQDGPGEVLLRNSADQPTPPTLNDFDLPHPSAAVVTFEPIKDSNAQNHNSWRFSVHVSGLLPANTTQQRYAVVKYGESKIQVIPYTLTNLPTNFAWTISKPPDPWVDSGWVPDCFCTVLTVTPKDSVATGLTLSSSGMVEQNTKRAITVGDLRLCQVSHCSGNDPIDLPANVPSRLQLCITKSFHGNFHGSISLASLQKPDGETILQNVDFSSFLAKLFGVGVISAGVFVAWWSKIWARARLERDQAIMPAVVMRAQLSGLQQVLAQLRQPYRPVPASLNAAIVTLLDELADDLLDEHQFLPPKFPNPYGYTVDTAGYKAYLESRNPRVELLSVLITQGVVPAQAEDNGSLTPAQQTLVSTAVGNVDQICANVPQPTSDQALALIQPILTGLHNALFPPPPNAPLAAPAPPAAPSREFEMLGIEIQSISKGVWLLYGILTTLSGIVVLIFNNSGFGIPVDFVLAFFWGFGIPTTAGAIAPTSAASALNIAIAKG